MKKDDEVLNDVINSIKKAKIFIVETDKKTAVCGSNLDILELFSSQVSELLARTNLDENMLRTAFDLGVDAYKGYIGKKDKIDEDIDKKIETIEKLMKMFKELRKEVE